MIPPDGQTPKPEMQGTVLAAQMIEQLALLNARLGQFVEIVPELHSMMDTLCGHFDAIHLAMENATRLKGKMKISIVDFAECWCEAVEEILPDDDDEDQGGDIPTPRR
jgi:hypothetical protein